MEKPVLLFFVAVFALTGFLRAATQDDGPKDFTILEARQIVRYKAANDTDLPARFNGQRPFAVSVARDLANTVKVREDLIQRLAQIRMLDQVVFEWFDVQDAKAFVVDIGNKVPVGVAQAALAAAGNHMKDMPVVLLISTQGDFDDVQRVYLGSRVPGGAKPLTEQKLAALLKPGITRLQFLRIATE